MKFFVAVLALGAAACAGKSETVVNARIAAPEARVAYGDCAEALRRAAANPELEVDRLPTKVSGPTPFTPTPASVQADIDKKGMAFKGDVMIDTLGKAVAGSLKVLETSNEWFPRNLNALLPRMTFSPAMLAGCKVPRVYKFIASAKPKG